MMCQCRPYRHNDFTHPPPASPPGSTCPRFPRHWRYDPFSPLTHLYVRPTRRAAPTLFFPSFLFFTRFLTFVRKKGSFVQHQQHMVARWTGVAGPRKTRTGGGAGALSMESTADFKNGMTIDIDGALQMSMPAADGPPADRSPLSARRAYFGEGGGFESNRGE